MRREYDFRDYDRRAERMRLVRERDLDAYFELLDELTELRTSVAEEIIKLARRLGCVMIRNMDERHARLRYYVSPSFTVDGGLRITAFDDFGPIRHNEIADSQYLEGELPQGRFLVCCKGA